MSAKPTRLFTLLFVAVTLFEMIGETVSTRWLFYTCKPLIMVLLLAYLWPRYQWAGRPSYLRWLMIGMVFALAGDVFLMIREVDLFAPGLGAFLIMQVCYSVAFGKIIRRSGRPIIGHSLWLTIIPFVLYSGVFLVVLRPTFAHDPALTVLWWPVVLYVICLTTMGLLATQTNKYSSTNLPGYGWVMAGALLFMLSDSAIAINKFLIPINGATWLVMTTYAAAQYLIVVGMANVPRTSVR